MPFIIILNQLQSVEIICASLRASGIIGASHLASNIEQQTIYTDEMGNQATLQELSEVKVKTKPNLQVVPVNPKKG